jgi:hypothetical protein
MGESSTERITAALLAIDVAGDLAASYRMPASRLSLMVDGVGPLALPLSTQDVTRLLERAVPSPFGHRDQTLHDPAVRKACEIPGERVHLDPAAWSSRVQRGLDRVVAALGVGPEVSAKLQKLVVYERGGFFAPHRDTEREPSMWGTLVLVLPSTYRGGDVVVSHAGASTTFSTWADSAAEQLCFVGFYADCVHEIRPVEAGHRVALTFSLHIGSNLPPPSPAPCGPELRQSLGGYFATQPKWLVVLLDHPYTQQRFGWSDLKNLDRARVGALLALATGLECACFLALADVCEHFEYLQDEDVEGYRPLSDASRESFGVRRGCELTLSRWMDERGEPCPGPDAAADDSCMVSTLGSLDRVPYRVAGAPWTGNEGGEAEQWYRQAALVLIPKTSPLFEAISRPRDKPSSASKVRVRRRRKTRPDGLD